jgi:hypothetical protein
MSPRPLADLTRLLRARLDALESGLAEAQDMLGEIEEAAGLLDPDDPGRRLDEAPVGAVVRQLTRPVYGEQTAAEARGRLCDWTATDPPHVQCAGPACYRALGTDLWYCEQHAAVVRRSDTLDE